MFPNTGRILEINAYIQHPYDDVIRDLPPEYSALPPLAQRKSTAVSFAPKTRYCFLCYRGLFLLMFPNTGRILEINAYIQHPVFQLHRHHRQAGMVEETTIPTATVVMVGMVVTQVVLEYRGLFLLMFPNTGRILEINAYIQHPVFQQRG
jgi:hypothetical protein